MELCQKVYGFFRNIWSSELSECGQDEIFFLHNSKDLTKNHTFI